LNICLIGFMGVGKTEVGRVLAERLGFEFIDTDDLIVSRAGKTIPQIFEQDGEPAFRARERDLLNSLQRVKGKVIAAGGGLPVQEGNLEKLREIGPVVCLEAEPEEIYRRVKNNHNRPLLQVDDPLKEIKALLKARQLYYQKADLIVRNESIEKTVGKIMDIMGTKWKK
ncbi:MAG: shikimate kinase, partial [bacterium]